MAEARSLFRAERIDEPLDKWRTTLERYSAGFRKLFETIGTGPLDGLAPDEVVALFKTGLAEYPRRRRGEPPLSKLEKKLRKEKLADLFRYLAGPPISADDLKVLAEVESVAPKPLASDPEGALRVLQTVIQALDPMRFPWLNQERDPQPEELEIAIAASAALATAQRVSTDRRNEGKATQEERVHDFLNSMDYEKVAPTEIRTIQDGPGERQFSGESMLGSRKADVVVRLPDRRLLAIECKVSNSGLNSVKRINNDAAIKARTWRDEFGQLQVVPMAVLSGVFKVSNLVQAQAGGLTLVWAHHLEELGAFVDRCQPR